MKKRLYIGILILEAIICVVLCVLGNVSGEDIADIMAFPFAPIGDGLRVLSLSGSIGNIIAIILYAGVSLITLGVVLTHGKKKSLHWRSNAVLLAESMNEVAGSVNLNKNSVETLLICGSESEFTKKEDRFLFSSVYECSRIIEIEGASHWVFVDKPAVLVNEIVMYLK